MAVVPMRRPEVAAAGAAPLAVLLRLEDAGLAARLGALPGLLPVADAAAAEVLVSDGPPEPGDPPALVLADGTEEALRALRAGALAVLPPDAAPAELAAAIAALAEGLAVLPAGVLAALAGRGAGMEAPGPGAASPGGAPEGGGHGAGLTPREREVLALLAAGASNKVIARRLGMSFHTAKAHVAAVLHKLGAASRADAVARGARAGLVLL